MTIGAAPIRRPIHLPRWKKLLYGLLTAAAFFVLLEVVLALAGVAPLAARRDPLVGFAPALPHFEERADLGEPPRMRTARNKLPYLNDQGFATQKPADGFRIFCLGGSTTYGQPYDDAASYVGWLRALLETAAPDREWEVVNGGGISYASYRVLALMEELVHYHPDLFIVYTGHNEFLEERTYREVRTMSPLRRRLTGAAAQTRIAAVMHRLFASNAQPAPVGLEGDVEAILDRTVGPTSYERDDRLRQEVVRHFAWSIGQMIELARAGGAEIVFIRPAANLRHCSPFKSQPGGGLSDTGRARWRRHIEAGRAWHAQGSFGEAVREFDAAIRLDGRHAELHYLHGQSLFALQEYELAEAAFRRAIDEDVCPLRMTSGLGAALDHVLQEHDVVTLDFHELLREDARRMVGHPILGREHFLDHVHPTVEAHGLLAMSLARRLTEAGLLPGNFDLSPERREAAARRVHGQIDEAAHGRAEGELARVLYWAGKIDEAGPLALKSLPHNQDDPRVWLIAGVYLHRLGKTDDALHYLRHAIRMSPHDERIREALEAIEVVDREQPRDEARQRGAD